MVKYLILPGLGNSGPDHWQTYFEHSADNFIRINQREWDAPSCKDWIETVNENVSLFEPSNVILVGHSLGCATISHWVKEYEIKIKGALLVAPSDIENPVYFFPATGFSPIPTDLIPFPSIVVASSNDPWVSLERSEYFAKRWGSRLMNIGEAGHINADSGYGKWEQGLEILHMLDR